MSDNNMECLESFSGTQGYINHMTYHFRKDDRTELTLNSFNLCVECCVNGGIIYTERKVRKYKEPLGSKHNIYYGYKEAKKLGLTYTYPDPERYNNSVNYK